MSLNHLFLIEQFSPSFFKIQNPLKPLCIQAVRNVAAIGAQRQ